MNPHSYSEIIKALREISSKIVLTYSTIGATDGRLMSAMKENEYLSILEKNLKESYPSLIFEKQPVDRWWWDFRVNSIPFNLKLTVGGTDNAFNKVAILYSISGQECSKKNMNFNQFLATLKTFPIKSQRDPLTEYHYLVVNKNDGKILIKSILDIHSFKSNPCNDLQINWNNEFKYLDHKTPDHKFKEKIQELLITVQTSVKQSIQSMNEFANANVESLLS